MKSYEKPLRPDELLHYGVLGMKWGVRRYQNPDGTLTPEGKRRLNGINYKESTRTINEISDSLNHLNSYKEDMKIKMGKYARKGDILKNKGSKKAKKYIQMGKEYSKRIKEIQDSIDKTKLQATKNGFGDFIQKGRYVRKNQYIYSGKHIAGLLLGAIIGGPVGLIATAAGVSAYIRAKQPYRIQDTEEYSKQYYDIYNRIEKKYSKKLSTTEINKKAKAVYETNKDMQITREMQRQTQQQIELQTQLQMQQEIQRQMQQDIELQMQQQMQIQQIHNSMLF